MTVVEDIIEDQSFWRVCASGCGGGSRRVSASGFKVSFSGVQACRPGLVRGACF